MKRRRESALGLGALALSSLLVTACGPVASGHTSKPRSAPAKDAIVAAVGELASTSYAVEVISRNGDVRESGTVDPSTRTGTLSASTTVQGVRFEMDAVMVSADIWVRMDLGRMNERFGVRGDAWMKLDPRKVAGQQSLPFDLADFSDALDMTKLLAGVDARRLDDSHLTGTIDLTRASGVNAPSPSDVSSAGDKARSVPFSATMDRQGRLTEVKIDGGRISPDLAVEIRFSDYGIAAPVTRPDDSQVVPTPDAVYQILGG